MKSVGRLLSPLFILIIWVSLFSESCTPRVYLTTRTIGIDDMISMDMEEGLRYHERLGINTLCNDAEGYIPDTSILEHYNVRKVKVSFHFMNSSDSTKNFPESEASSYAWHLLQSVNEGMVENRKLFLPEGNDIPVLPALIQFEWTGSTEHPAVQHHYDDELYFIVTRGKDRNISDRRPIDKYVTNDSVINIFVMPHHPDSMASPTYIGHRSGIALGTNVKIFGAYENETPFWDMRGLLAHELGHVLGLSHAWTGYDGCDDTAKHPNNCFSQTGIPPCDGPISNNLMDYNTHQNALSPCQIGKMHANLSRTNSKLRQLMIKDWCTLDTNRNVIIADSVHWIGSKDLGGNVIIKEGGVLIVDCRLSFPEHASLVVEPGGHLYLRNAYLHNDCGKEWNGIQAMNLGEQKQGKVFSYGLVRVDNVATDGLPLE